MRANRIEGDLTYDNNGNMTRKVAAGVTTTATYNQRNLPTQLATPSGNETNTYGPNGERATMGGASIENRTVAVQYDLTGNPIADHDLSGTAAVWTYRLYGPGIDECLGEYRRPNSRRTYQLHDALGSVTAVANDAGQVAYRSTYKAFGDMSRTADASSIPTTRLGYTSRESSVGGLMQYRSRYYDPGYGRFLQQDRFKGTGVVPPSLHRYVYTHNNPIRYVDPTGESISPSGALAAGEGLLLLNTFFSIMVLISVIGIVTAEVVSIGENDAATSRDMQQIIGYFMGIIGLANALMYLSGAAGAIAYLGLGTLSSASAIAILLNPGDYTRCEVDGAVGLIVLGMMMTAIWNIFFPGTFLKTDAIVSMEYALIAYSNLLTLGWTLLWSAKLMSEIAKPYATRLRDCNERGY